MMIAYLGDVMRLDGDTVVLETPWDGVVAADAAAVVDGDGSADEYRHLVPDALPTTMSLEASAAAFQGLKDVVDRGLTLHGYLDPTFAQGYLAILAAEASEVPVVPSDPV